MKAKYVISVITLVSCMFLTIDIHGQILKGTVRVGPDFSFSSSTTEFDALGFKIKNSSLSLGAQLGYYFIDNFEVTLAASVFSNKQSVEDIEETFNGFAIGPNLEYKFNLSPEWYFTIGAGLGYNSATNDDDIAGEITYSGLSYRAFGSLEFISNNKIGAFISIGPEFGTLKDPDSDSEFDLSTIGIGMGFGFYFD